MTDEKYTSDIPEGKERSIKLGNGYWLCNNRWCFWISIEMTSKNGKKFLRNISGYHPSVENAFVGLSDHVTASFDTKSIKVLIKEIKSTKTMIEKMLSDVEISKRIAEVKDSLDL